MNGLATPAWRAALRVLVAGMAAVVLATGCSAQRGGWSEALGYGAQAVAGHLELLQRARPVPELLADPATPAALAERLQLSQRIRDFAVSELQLPDNSSYRRFADLPREAAVWNVVAAPALSLTLQTWCFPVVGCVAYRGYFDRSAAEAQADALRRQGLEASVLPVPAYSTLGYASLLGGDPLLSTFIRWPEGALAQLVFHELSHQVAYAAGDTTFNESFATAVERIGIERWLAQPGHEAARAAYAAGEARRQDFRELTQRTRAALQALFEGPLPAPEKAAAKARLLAAMRAEHGALKAGRWHGFGGYDAWFAQANNASLGLLAAYNTQVGDFMRLYDREGRDLPRFYAAVQRLAAQTATARSAGLR